VRTELGARFDDPTIVYGKPLILFGRLAWAHDFANNPTLNAVFQALPDGASRLQSGRYAAAASPFSVSELRADHRQFRSAPTCAPAAASACRPTS
jgi:hypothetical protein